MPAEPLDDAFWRRRLEAAIDLRKQLGYADPHGAARLVFSEADGLSGLIVDRYGEYLAIQATALAMAQRLDEWRRCSSNWSVRAESCIRTERGVVKMEGMPHETGVTGANARRAGLHRRARAALRRRSARRAERRASISISGRIAVRRPLLPRSARARPVLLQRRVRA